MSLKPTSPPAYTANPSADWLSTALGEPEQAARQWLAHGMALLPLGVIFSAARITDEIVHAAVHSDRPAVVADVE
ncbi:hypothetical protein [Streptomyces sp. NPDC000410]|uniref:hypothetical protein n=1 Tax=Streptomyces sp. NPDC000410 TaxID=3154254 RepID=UPI0033193101